MSGLYEKKFNNQENKIDKNTRYSLNIMIKYLKEAQRNLEKHNMTTIDSFSMGSRQFSQWFVPQAVL